MIALSFPIIILMVAAIVPGIWLLRYIYRLDRVDKEPSNLLAKLFVLGIISTICAMFTETIGMNVFGYILSTDSIAYMIIENFIIVALSEEGFKYLVLKKATWNNPNFNCSFDGVVYAVFVSLGFAVWENIKYVFSYGLMTALVRAVTAVPGHTCFGVLMGACYALAKKYEIAGDMASCKKAKRLALILPIIAHGTYDFFASMASWIGSVLFVVVVVLLFYFCYRLVKNLSVQDQYIRDDYQNPQSPF